MRGVADRRSADTPRTYIKERVARREKSGRPTGRRNDPCGDRLQQRKLEGKAVGDSGGKGPALPLRRQRRFSGPQAPFHPRQAQTQAYERQ
jgi:hypothetical protein